MLISAHAGRLRLRSAGPHFLVQQLVRLRRAVLRAPHPARQTRHSRENGEMESRLKCNTVEHLTEDLVWSLVVETLSWCIVVPVCDELQLSCRHGRQVGLSRQ